MTVFELIQKLETLPPEAIVWHEAQGGIVNVVHQRIDSDTHETYIWLE